MMVRTYDTYYFLGKYTLKVLKSHLNESTNSKSKLLCIYSGVLVNSFFTNQTVSLGGILLESSFLFMHSILSNGTNQGSLYVQICVYSG